MNRETVEIEHPAQHEVTVFVEVNNIEKKIEFEHHVATGAEIRKKAGALASDDLTRLKHGKPVGGNISPSETVHLKNHEHFLASPGGTVSQ